LTFDESVVVVEPPGVVVVVSFFVPASSEQPDKPIPNPRTTTPIIVTLISFRMDVASV